MYCPPFSFYCIVAVHSGIAFSMHAMLP